MEPQFDSIEEERAYYERRELRRKRRMQELKRKKRRRLIIKLSLSAAVLCMVMILSVTALVKTVKAKRLKNETDRMETQQTEMQPGEDSIVTTEEVPLEETSESEVVTSVPVATEVYEFLATENTKTIYSDQVISSHAILVDESTDTIIAAKGAKERISPASMTKVLTVLVAAEHITEEQLDDTFTMTLEITDYSYVNDCSNVGFLEGEQVKVRDLFYGTILPSGGDAAVGLATYVAGSHEAFVDMMNDKLAAMGLSDTAHFTNCVGLYDADHYCTIYDMAIIMKAAMENPICREVLGTRCHTTEATEQHPEGITISNWFIRRIEDKDTNGEVVGAKTGYVVESGNCAVSYEIHEDGTPYICATAGSTSSWRCIYDHVEIYKNYAPTSGE